jgi:hypothetical protein
MQVQYSGKPVIIKDPNLCPHCHVVNKPTQLAVWLSKDTDGTPNVISVWQCSNESCNKLFLANHRFDGNHFKFSRFLNGLPKGPDWPKPISDLKCGNPLNPDQPEQTHFIKTYLQSLVAENSGLDEIAGMGYRKAIEYLVKDWAILCRPEDKDKIKNSWLGAVINDYYTGDLKEILERATWLGNDQAHYNQLFEEYDLDVLKELIELILVELDRQYKKNHYIETIQKRK